MNLYCCRFGDIIGITFCHMASSFRFWNKRRIGHSKRREQLVLHQVFPWFPTQTLGNCRREPKGDVCIRISLSERINRLQMFENTNLKEKICNQTIKSAFFTFNRIIFSQKMDLVMIMNNYCSLGRERRAGCWSYDFCWSHDSYCRIYRNR